MTPKEYKQMMNHLTRPKKPLVPKLEEMIDLYDGPVIVDNGDIKFERELWLQI